MCCVSMFALASVWLKHDLKHIVIFLQLVA